MFSLSTLIIDHFIRISRFKSNLQSQKMYKILIVIGSISILAAGTSAKVTSFVKSPHEADTLKLQLILDPTSVLIETQGEQDLISRKDDPSPVIFWHGMGDTAYGSINLERLALQKNYPGLRVYSIQIGSNAMEDDMASYFANVNDQVKDACNQLLNNDYIKKRGSLNFIGFSQGAQFLRALIQRCPFSANNINVKNYISLGGQHQGVFGLPNCPANKFLCDHIRHLLTYGAYEETVQKHLVQAQYWHDPLNEQAYREKNLFLSDINNELRINETYRNRLLELDNMVLVEFLDDDMVVPRESSLFGFYASGKTDEIVNLNDSQLYLEDRLGLKELHDNGRLHLIRVPGKHLQYKMSWFLQQIASVYLVD